MVERLILRLEDDALDLVRLRAQEGEQRCERLTRVIDQLTYVQVILDEVAPWVGVKGEGEVALHCAVRAVTDDALLGRGEEAFDFPWQFLHHAMGAALHTR